MKPQKFKQQNVTFAEDQPEYQPLPAYVDAGKEGTVVTCWRLSFMDKVRAIFCGRLWLSMQTYGYPLHPVTMSMKKTDILLDPCQVKPERNAGK